MENTIRTSSDPRLVRGDSNASSEKSARHSYDAKSEDGLPPAYSDDPIITELSTTQDHDLGHIPPPSSHRSLSHVARPESSSRPPHSSAHIHRTRARSPNSTPHNSTAVPIPGDYSRHTTYDPETPPAYAEKKYEKMSWEEEKRMRKRDYAIEISRIMGKQLVKSMRPASARADGTVG